MSSSKHSLSLVFEYVTNIEKLEYFGFISVTLDDAVLHKIRFSVNHQSYKFFFLAVRYTNIFDFT